jgi:hypothetical protein
MGISGNQGRCCLGIAAAGAALATAACGPAGGARQPASQTLQPAMAEGRHLANSGAAVRRWGAFATEAKAPLAGKRITANRHVALSQDWEKLQGVFDAGTGPDVVHSQGNRVIPGGVRGSFLQLDDPTKRVKVRRDDHSQRAWDSWVWKGTLYAIASGTSTGFLDRYAGTRLREGVDAWERDRHDQMVSQDSAGVNPVFIRHSAAAFGGEETARQALRNARDEINAVLGRRPADLR